MKKASLSKPKKWWIISFAAVVLILVSFIGWSFYAWHDYDQQSGTWYKDLRQQGDVTFKMKQLTHDEKTKKLTAMQRIEAQTLAANNYCNRYNLLHWEQFIPVVKTRIDQCRTMASRVAEFGHSLGLVTGYLESELKLATAFTEAKVATDIAEPQWQDMADSWAKTSEKIQRLQVPSELKEAQKTAIDKTKAIQTAWTALITASQAKDRQKYEAALDQIGVAYTSTSQIVEMGEKSFKLLTSKLGVTYKHAFS